MKTIHGNTAYNSSPLSNVPGLTAHQLQRIKQRAYDLHHEMHGNLGMCFDDWRQAESEILGEATVGSKG